MSDIKKIIKDFLSVPEQYQIAKETALNIIVKSNINGSPEFAQDLEYTIKLVSTLHLLHGLSFEQIEAEAEYTMLSENDVPLELSEGE